MAERQLGDHHHHIDDNHHDRTENHDDETEAHNFRGRHDDVDRSVGHDNVISGGNHVIG